MLDNKMIALQLYVEKCDKILKNFKKEFRPSCYTTIAFDKDIAPIPGAYVQTDPVIKARLHDRWNPPNIKVVYLPFQYAGLKIKLDLNKS